VFRAADPELQRHVAIKVVRVRRGERAASEPARARLLREARALARLSHPGVVAVFDVGTVGDDVFLAMELVEGLTLQSWLAAAVRTVPEIVDVFAQAGRGLAAAHAAGLVHRDFKPTNVIVSDDGRARVLDFGLVRDPRQTMADGPGHATDDGDDADDRDGVLTRTGVAVGTPAYMAPEQHRGERADARSDQFSFCVALHEALFGALPFTGDTVATLRAAVLAGRRTPPRTARRVPARLERLLARGLEPEPARRFPSMDELLRVLAPAARGRGRTIAVAAVAVAAAAAVAAVVGARGVGAAPVCTGGTEELARAWGAERRARIGAAFAASGLPYAGTVWASTAEALDGYAQRWVAAHREACVATRVRGTQSEALLDRRMACLDRRLDELDAVAAKLEVADAPAIERSLEAAQSLTAVQRCADLSVLSARVAPPSADVEAGVAEVRRELAAVKAAEAVGELGAVLARARDAQARAAALAYPPLEAEALYWLGVGLLHAGEYRDAARHLERAVWSATAAGDDRTVVQAASMLVEALGVRRAEIEPGRLWHQHARASLARLGGDAAEDAALTDRHAALLAAGGDFAQARQIGEQAVAAYEALYGAGDARLASALNRLGSYLADAYEYTAADERYRRALAIFRRELGAEHPAVATVLTNLGATAAATGAFDLALEHHRAALAIRERVYPADHPEVAATLHNLGYPLIVLGKHDEALAAYRRAIDINTRKLGPDHPRLASSYYQLGYLHSVRGRHEEAAQAHGKALALREAAFGPDHAMVGDIALELGNARRAQGRWEEALALYERSLRIRAAKLGAAHLKTIYTRVDVASCHLALGRHDEALPALEAAAAALERPDAHAAMVEQTRFLLARALWDASPGRRDRRRARRLAQTALRGHEQLDGQQAAVAEIRAWLRDR
jgi:tetratricopeptide (TPR) repeat protein